MPSVSRSVASSPALRESAFGFAELDAAQLQHLLVTESGPGAGIRWHRDNAVFGVSFILPR